MGEIDTAIVAVFVPLASGIVGSSVAIADRMVRSPVTVGSTVTYLGLVGLYGSQGGHLSD